jgi:lysophospholipase L1-like esterase
MGKANHEISVNNRAVSGTSIMSANGVWSQVQATNFLPYDVCSIFIGSNDYTYGRDKATFKSEYKQVLDYIIAAKPSLKIFICTLIERGDVQVTQRFYDLSEGIRELGIEYSIPVLDLAQDCLLDLRDSEQQALWSRPDGNGGYDKLHPTQEAHELFLAPLFKAKLMKVLNDYTLFPDILELENFDEI